MNQGDPLDQIQEVLLVPLRWELVRYRALGLGPHCSSGKHTRIKNKQRLSNLFTVFLQFLL